MTHLDQRGGAVVHFDQHIAASLVRDREPDTVAASVHHGVGDDLTDEKLRVLDGALLDPTLPQERADDVTQMRDAAHVGAERDAQADAVPYVDCVGRGGSCGSRAARRGRHRESLSSSHRAHAKRLIDCGV